MQAGDPRPAVFLDRDGTLVREVDFLRDAADLELLPGVPAALRRLRAAGFALVVTTNQSGIARGLLDETRLFEIHERLVRELAAEDVHLDRIDWCPHHPTIGEPPWRADCDCRKPRPGLLQRAIAALGLEVRGSWTIGDSERDVLAGRALSIPGILVGTGRGTAELERMKREGRSLPRFSPDLASAVERIQQNAGQNGAGHFVAYR
jgi:D-glycero-D-manno-heptose 1,7-bisphosphate phosphatase